MELGVGKNMVASITPSDEKLISKGVKSVRQHIALLKDYIDLDIEAFKRYTREHLCTSETILDEEAERDIEDIEREYLTQEFIYGSNPRYTQVNRQRIEGVGDIEVRMEIKNGIIKSVNILGDYFLLGDLNAEIIQPLTGKPLDHDSIFAALPEHPEQIIRNITKNQLTSLIYGK